MIRSKILKLTAFAAVIVASTSFENCANKQFSTVDAQGRASKLATETVFPTDGVNGEIPGAGGSANGSIPILGQNGSGGIPANGGTGSTSGSGMVAGTNGGSGSSGSGVIGGSNGSGGGSLFPNSGSTGTTQNAGANSQGSTTASLPGMPPETFLPSSDPLASTTSPSRGPASVPTSSTTGLVGGGITSGTPIGDLPTPFTGRTFPIAFDCSDYRSDANSNLASAKVLAVDLTDNTGAPVCSFQSSTLRDALVQTKLFDATIIEQNCPSLPLGKYALRLRDPLKAMPTGVLGGQPATNFLTDVRTTNLVYNTENKQGLIIEKKSAGVWSRSDRFMNVITDRNPYTDQGDNLVNMQMLTDRTQCDAHQSPLIIHLNSDVGSLDHLIFTPPSAGILFDILGRNSYPTADTPKRISWHKNLSYLFLALPDANGQVKGIDQLFGNNTMGPDGRLALNGYEALSKYDGKTADGQSLVSTPDGYINRSDAIFSKLRVWRDENFDGVAQPNELYSLSDAGITAIDLHYDPSFYERDKYGNETKYKSVVQTRDGKLHLMFDLWFAYQEH